MSYRSAAKRQAEDTDRLVGPDGGLDPGEWISYWVELPHDIKGRMTSAATIAKVNPDTGLVEAIFDAGVAALVRIRLGIVDWFMLDEAGQPIPWDPTQAATLVDGLSGDTFMALQRRIGNGRAPDLAAPANPEIPNSETVGND